MRVGCFSVFQIDGTSREISICESVGHGKFRLFETDGDDGGGILLPVHLLVGNGSGRRGCWAIAHHLNHESTHVNYT